MSDLLSKLLAKKGKSISDLRANSKVGMLSRRQGVRKSAELERVMRLPRRVWEEDIDDELLERLSSFFRTPQGQMTFRAVQAAYIQEVHDFGGALGAITVGGGKTLITAILPTVLDLDRPLLLIPKKLETKTLKDFERLGKHFYIRTDIRLMSYELLGREQSEDFLAQYRPQLIMADEAQRLKNLKAAVTKRVKRHMNEEPDTVFCGLTGTVTGRSLHEYWHLLYWATKDDLLPLTRDPKELADWANAVDEKVPDHKRLAPGALLELAGDEHQDKEPIVRARLGLQRRLRESACFVSTTGADCDASIQLERIVPPKSEAIDAAVRTLYTDETTPNGDLVYRPVDMWRNANQLTCGGFYYAWDPPAPEAWLIARREYGMFVRHALANLSNARRRLDSPLQVYRAIMRGDFTKQVFAVPMTEPRSGKKVLGADGMPVYVERDIEGLLNAWVRLRPTFKPKTVDNWIDESRVRWVAKNFLRDDDPMIVWVDSVAIGTKLAQISGRPFFHRQGLDQHGNYIEDPAFANKPIIASITSNGEGRNLQAWSKMFVAECRPNGSAWEQLIGRIHRTGQEEDELWVGVMLGHPLLLDAFKQAYRDAKYSNESTGAAHRLLLADLVGFDNDYLDTLKDSTPQKAAEEEEVSES